MGDMEFITERFIQETTTEIIIVEAAAEDAEDIMPITEAAEAAAAEDVAGITEISITRTITVEDAVAAVIISIKEKAHTNKQGL